MMTKKTKEEFFDGIMVDSAHHAKLVIKTIPVIWKELNSCRFKKIRKWRTHTCWIETPTRMYFFTYNHTTKTIDIKLDSQRGTLIKSINDLSCPHDTLRFIKGL
jgi:hypothetical protein